MKRWIFNILAAMSLVLLAVTAAMWVRGCCVQDHLTQIDRWLVSTGTNSVDFHNRTRLLIFWKGGWRLQITDIISQSVPSVPPAVMQRYKTGTLHTGITLTHRPPEVQVPWWGGVDSVWTTRLGNVVLQRHIIHADSAVSKRF